MVLLNLYTFLYNTANQRQVVKKSQSKEEIILYFFCILFYFIVFYLQKVLLKAIIIKCCKIAKIKLYLYGNQVIYFMGGMLFHFRMAEDYKLYTIISTCLVGSCDTYLLYIHIWYSYTLLLSLEG